MANIDGTWDLSLKSPMGEQKSVMRAQAEGDAFTGTVEANGQSIEAQNGQVTGDGATWTVRLTSPMPISLDAKVTIDGDEMTGTMTAGAFGSFPLIGKRRA